MSDQNPKFEKIQKERWTADGKLGDKEYVDALLEFVYTRIVEKHKNLSAAYRLFDKQGKGHLSRAEFSLGL